jgi:predicted membrane channel-forming protein YqfA (hemolysin III family)
VDLGDVLWAMLAFLFWVMFFWMFIAVFGDIFRRDDLSGWGKAGWILLVFVLPLIGLLIYVISRPRMSERDMQLMGRYDERGRYSAADEVAKLAQLRDAGEISPDEFERLKNSAMTRI